MAERVPLKGTRPLIYITGVNAGTVATEPRTRKDTGANTPGVIARTPVPFPGAQTRTPVTRLPGLRELATVAGSLAASLPVVRRPHLPA